ncbi:polysialyltransferase family glycosyltransferase [Pseudoalteromonas sp. PS5]|uniref:polysialyltransferase family glycosyltransferase n=1 Tax=Pseudoalteromonas sp. PS5 TaxID=1437473 RepID=UPI000FFE7A6C|nr:polysialyltransferase family glycosyltransferase [Pseudoalteromonas sp. PS5]RXF01987.1 hypothetical protein D9603_12150 [Pseudoalteromonas sp. PS5]
MNYVICQSPKYLMASINKYKATKNCKIVIREVKGVYDFLIEYKVVPPEDLIFLPVYRRKSIFGLFLNFLSIKKFFLKYGVDIDDIFVFTNECDFTTMSIINGLVDCNVYFGEFYNDGLECFNLSYVINLFLFGVRLRCNKKIEFYLPVNEKRIEVKSWDYGEERKINKLLILGEIKAQAKKLLIVDSNDQRNRNLFFVKEIYSDLINLCKKNNIQIIIKGHPRLGLSKCLQDVKGAIYIKNTIPMEFIDIDSVDHICGFYSSALFNSSLKKKAKSLLMLSASKQESFYRNYLTSNGFNEEKFVLKIEDAIV